MELIGFTGQKQCVKERGLHRRLSGHLESRYSYPKATIGGSSGCVSRRRWRHVGGGGEETQSAQVEPRDQMGLLL